MYQTDPCWKPSASLAEIRRRAELLRCVREYFFTHQVMEVEVPMLSSASTVDPFIQSFHSEYCGNGKNRRNYFLHTSPEFPMKRLLSAGSGDIYYLGKVFRNGESGGKHNPEFTMLEWYRKGMDHHALMDDVSRLLESVCDFIELERVSYRKLFEKHYGFDPHTASCENLLQQVAEHIDAELAGLSRNDCLDLLFSHGIEPHLGYCQKNELAGVYVYDYPESMSALARLVCNREGQTVSARFELFVGGMELANGYYELDDGTVLEERFRSDQRKRKQSGMPVTPFDHNLVSAMKSGFPECAGVALGIDRLHMLLSETRRIRDVISFDFQRA